jgi:simple sugar transport system ATP-binding protein
MALCDSVTVMRAGAVVLECAIAQTSIDGIAQAMVGRQVQQGHQGEYPQPGGALLQAKDLRWRDALGVLRLDGVSLTLHAHEIVGIAGVSGNGQSELLDALAGLLAPQEGSLALGGETFRPHRWLTPDHARALRLAHVPEDRHARGLVLPFAACESAVLGYQALSRYRRGGVMNRSAMQNDTAEMMERYDVRPRNPLLRSSRFSGGNQQKLVLAREALHQPKVMLVGQPTRGVDIGAIEFIHSSLRAMRDEGGAVLVVSSELDEVLALASRVIVMNGGRIAGELPIAQCSEAALGRLMGGVEKAAA